MGFGFNLLIAFFIVPITVVLLVLWLITRKPLFGKLVGVIWTGIFSLSFLIWVVSIFTDKKKINQEDVYGEYVIDREKFPGKQADWQYNNFRFEITEQDSLFFYVTNKSKILKTYKGEVYFHHPRSGIIYLKFSKPTHHIIENNPTLYREIWGFYYVKNSSKFGNVFFKKGNWENINK